MSSTKCDVFICYAHADNEHSDRKKCWLERLLVFLRPFVKQENLAIFSDKDNRTSDFWHSKIQAHLNSASAAILLVSADFLASEYIRNNELPILLKNAVEHGLKLFPIIVAPCSFERATFKYPDPINGPNVFKLSSIQAANSPTETLADMSEAEQSRILRDVAEQISDVIQQKKAS